MLRNQLEKKRLRMNALFHSKFQSSL